MRKWACAAAVFLALTVAHPAAACRMYQSPAMKVSRPYDAVIVTTITGARFIDPAGTGLYVEDADKYPPWRATANFKRSIEGYAPKKAYSFTVFGASAACIYWQPIAIQGQDWVLYLYKNKSDGSFQVAEAYPLDFIRDMDPRFGSGAKPKP